MKVPDPKSEVTITFEQFSDICAEIGVEMTQITAAKFGKGMGDQIYKLTTIYAAELVKHLFPQNATLEIEDRGNIE